MNKLFFLIFLLVFSNITKSIVFCVTKDGKELGQFNAETKCWSNPSTIAQIFCKFFSNASSSDYLRESVPIVIDEVLSEYQNSYYQKEENNRELYPPYSTSINGLSEEININGNDNPSTVYFCGTIVTLIDSSFGDEASKKEYTIHVQHEKDTIKLLGVYDSEALVAGSKDSEK